MTSQLKIVSPIQRQRMEFVDRAPVPIKAPITVATVFQPFTYDELQPDLVAEAQQTEAKFAEVQRQSIVDLGSLLRGIKDKMPHGTFIRWIDGQLKISVSTAENLMRGGQWLEAQSHHVAKLPPSAVYALSLPSADQTIVSEIVADCEQGNVPSASEVRDRLNRARKATDHAKNLEQLKKDKENEKRRRAAQAERDRKCREDWEKAELFRKQAAEKAAAFLIEVMSEENIQQLKNLMFGTHWAAVSDAISTQLFRARGGAA
jgi:hypothetical protein